MIKLKTLILENESINIDDVNALVSSKWTSRDAISLLKTIEAFYYSDKPEEKGWAEDYLNLLNKVFAYIIEIVKKLNIPHVNEKTVNAPRG